MSTSAFHNDLATVVYNKPNNIQTPKQKRYKVEALIQVYSPDAERESAPPDREVLTLLMPADARLDGGESPDLFGPSITEVRL